MQRRSFLKGAGVITIVAVGGVAWRACDEGVFSVGEGPAYEPWKDWRNANGTPLALVHAAILAASPHNTQPWLFKVSNSAIELHIDTRRNVGALDPYLREEHIGIGCALENLLLAAPANGFTANATLEPGKLEPIPAEPGPQLLARVELTPWGQSAPGELYNAIPHRHTNRGPYDPHKPIPSDFLRALAGLPGDDPEVKIFLFTADADRRKIAEFSFAANNEIYSDPKVQQATRPWVRTKWSSVQKHRDGLTIDAFGLPPVAGAIAKIIPLRWLDWLGNHSAAHGYVNLMLSAPVIGFIAVRDRYDREQALKVGRIWQRAHLLATASGLAARPCNELVEMVDHERAQGKPATRVAMLNEITGDPTWQPTFVFYAGHPMIGANPSPRRSVETVTL